MGKVNDRYRFKGIYDGVKVVKVSNHKKTQLTTCFKHLVNLTKQEYFRNHNHIVLDKLTFQKVSEFERGQVVEFTATVYNYTKLNRRTYTQRRQQGLKDLDKLLVL